MFAQIHFLQTEIKLNLIKDEWSWTKVFDYLYNVEIVMASQ